VSSIIPNDFVVPGTAHQFNFLRATGSLANVPLTVAIVATKSAAGTGVVGTVYDAPDAATTDALSGQSSEGAIMARKAYECAALFGAGPRVKLTLVAEPSGGVANVKTLTFVGTATSDGNAIVRIAGRTFIVGIQSGQTQNTIAANASATFNGKAEQLPVIVTVAANVVTFTHPTKGVNGKDVVITITQQVAGVVGTVANTVVGSGAADLQPALDALAPLRYDGIAMANHVAADITEIGADIATRWAVSSKNWGWYFMFEPGTIGTATSLAAAANALQVLIGSFEGCLNAPGEGAVAMAMLVFSRERANAGYDGAVVPLYPPNESVLYTPAEQNVAIHAGLTAFVGLIDSTGAVTDARAKCIQMVTTKTTTSGQPDDKNRDIAVARTGVSLAIQLDVAAGIQLGAETNPDGINQADSVDLIRDLASAIMRAEARAKPPVLNPAFVEADIAAIAITPDSNVLGRNNVKLPYHPETPLHQIGWEHSVIIGA
jgi:phage tail sheath gpL-like